MAKIREIDLDLLKEPIGKFTLEGKEYVIFEPTLEQILTNYKRSQTVTQELESIREKDPESDEGKSAWYARFWEWRMEQVKIWIPELTMEQIKKLLPVQIDAILEVVNRETEEQDTKKNSKKK